MIAPYAVAASPLSLHRHLPEPSSPSRVSFAAQNRRALDAPGRSENLSQTRERGKMQSPLLFAPAASRWSAPGYHTVYADSLPKSKNPSAPLTM
jgi:hypothetical protein